MVYELTRAVLRSYDTPCYAFAALADDVKYQGFLMNLLHSGPSDGMPAVVAGELSAAVETQQYWHLVCHDEAGRRRYDVSPGLAQRLRHTELRGLRADDVRLPHPAVYLKVPPEADLWLWNDTSKWHRCCGLYIVEDPMGGMMRAKNVSWEEALRSGQYEMQRSWRILAWGEPKPIDVGLQVKYDNDALVFFQVPLPEGTSIDDAIERSQTEARQHIEKIKARQLLRMLDQWRSIFRWAMNAMLYATLPDAELAHVWPNAEAQAIWSRARRATGKKRGKLDRQLNELRARGARPCTAMGRSLTIDRTIEPAGPEPSARRGKSLTVRSRVSGHWRRQACGPRHSERRLTWIEPHWRGPELGTVTPPKPTRLRAENTPAEED